MHYLPIPRRFRRPLLFPPGLLALAWLLCLSCAALPQMRGAELRRVIQFNQPSITRSPLYWEKSPVHLEEDRLEMFRAWQTVKFIGNRWHDYFAERLVLDIFQQFQTNPNRDAGIRITFDDSVTYSSLLYCIDALQYAGHADYWLDIKREPTRLYVYTRYQPFVGTDHCPTLRRILIIEPEPSYWERFLEAIGPIFSRETYAPLFSPDWRTSTLLLLLMSLLSIWKLRRQI